MKDYNFNEIKEERKVIKRKLEVEDEMKQLGVTQEEINFLTLWFTDKKEAENKKRYYTSLIIKAHRENKERVRIPMGLSLNIDSAEGKFHNMFRKAFGDLNKAYLMEKEIKELGEYGTRIDIDRNSSLTKMTEGVLEKESYYSCKYTKDSVAYKNKIIKEGAFKYIFSQVCRTFIGKYVSNECIQELNIDTNDIRLVCSYERFHSAQPIVYLELTFEED